MQLSVRATPKSCTSRIYLQSKAKTLGFPLKKPDILVNQSIYIVSKFWEAFVLGPYRNRLALLVPHRISQVPTRP
uniref:Uncharacterized protein n=1 Tax=uncultured marine bacterium 582 TaxID=257402 RepID=Q6SEZ2_9BACT|nr:hypothetical protein MBMO_EBAC080-L028H02.95 [uncultured marine bacterium 582]